jgi:hypothetical protein
MRTGALSHQWGLPGWTAAVALLALSLSLFSPAFAELALSNAPSSIAIFDGDIYNFGRISGTYYVVPSRTIRT